MKNILTVALLICLTHFSQAQIWEPHPVNFPTPTQGWRITPATDSVAWTFGFVLDSVGEYTESDYSYSRTTDGGNTWTVGTFPGIQQNGWLSSIFAKGPNDAWIAFYDYSEGGKIFRTSDGGQSWDQMEAPIADVFVSAIYFWDNDHGMVWGDPIDSLFSIFTTSDAGLSWQKVDENHMPRPIDNEEYTISGNYAVSGDNIWFDTYYNRVFYSPDRGLSWSVWDSPTSTHNGIDLKADEDNYLYYIQIAETPEGETSYELYRRHPEETDWTNLTPTDNSKYISGFAHVPGTKTLLSNLADETRLSYDHGETWISVDMDTSFVRGFASFVNDHVGYCCQVPYWPLGYEHPTEYVYKYIGSPLLGLLKHKPIDISMTLYPNPASDHLKLNISGIQPTDYWILINDLSGHLIFKTEITNEASFEKIIDVSTLAKGSYIITVSNSQGMQTQKFLKM